MPPVRVDAEVRLKEDDCLHALPRGAIGVVVGVWLSPRGMLCEVEFPKPVRPAAVRALLHAQQLEVIE